MSKTEKFSTTTPNTDSIHHALGIDTSTLGPNTMILTFDSSETNTIYKRLPPNDESFDLIALTSTNNSSIPIIELLRVTKKTGEIKIGGLHINVTTKAKHPNQPGCGDYVVFTGHIQRLFDNDGNSKFGDGIALADTNQPNNIDFGNLPKGVSTYLLINGLPRKKFKRDGVGIYKSSIMMLRKDDQVPTASRPNIFTPQHTTSGSLNKYPLLGKILKLDTNVELSIELRYQNPPIKSVVRISKGYPAKVAN